MHRAQRPPRAMTATKISSSAKAADPPSRPMCRLERLARDRAAALWAAAYPRGYVPGVSGTSHPRGYWFDPETAERPIRFIEGYCRHHKGEWAGQPLILEEWQRFVRRQVFGWKRADGFRLYRLVYEE